MVSTFPHERWRQETQEELEFKSSLGYMRPCRDKVKLEKGRDEEERERRERQDGAAAQNNAWPAEDSVNSD